MKRRGLLPNLIKKGKAFKGYKLLNFKKRLVCDTECIKCTWNRVAVFDRVKYTLKVL